MVEVRMSEPLYRTKTRERNNVVYVRQLVDSGRPKRFHKRITVPITKEMYQRLLEYRKRRNQNEFVRQAIKKQFENNPKQPNEKTKSISLVGGG